MVGIQINELVVIAKNNLVMSKLDLELEKAKKEKEDLAKELEKAENEAVAAEMKRQIAFLKSTQFQANHATQGPGTLSGSAAHTLHIPNHPALCANSNCAKHSLGGNTSNISNQNVGASSSQGF